MKRSFFVLVTLFACLFITPRAARAQSQADADDPPKLEVGVHFSTLTLTPADFYRTEIGFGGRLTYNFHRNVALEAETNFFPNSGFSGGEPRNAGNAAQGLFGVKAGKRWEKFGVFAKVRPGFTSFSDGKPTYDFSNPAFVDFRARRATHLTVDAGGVLELYVSRRWMTRFDVGDTIIHYKEQDVLNFFAPPTFITLPKETRHNLQVTAGIGFRFD